MNAYHVCGVLFAAWAVLVSFLGITREDFPSSAGAQRAVTVISIVLAIATIGSAVYTGATESEHEDDGGEQALLHGS